MATLNIAKVTALPGTLAANTIYIVTDSGDAAFAEIYVTNNAGSAQRRLPTRSDINSMIATALTGYSSLEVVADIAARDALVLTSNTLVLVKDASADPDVNSGAATYVYEQALDAYDRIAEFESLDIVLDWSNIQNGPSSSPSAIDQAVTDSHTHANKSQLDKIDEDTNQCPTYDGAGFAMTGTVAW